MVWGNPARIKAILINQYAINWKYNTCVYAISMQTIKLLEIRFTVESLAEKSVIIWLLPLFEAIRLLFCEHKFKHKWILKRNMWCTRSSFGWPNGQTNRFAKSCKAFFSCRTRYPSNQIIDQPCIRRLHLLCPSTPVVYFSSICIRTSCVCRLLAFPIILVISF